MSSLVHTLPAVDRVQGCFTFLPGLDGWAILAERRRHHPHLLRQPRPERAAHVHVDRDDQSAKFWLAPVALARNLGFSAAELRGVQRLVEEHEPRLLEAWHEYFRR